MEVLGFPWVEGERLKAEEQSLRFATVAAPTGLKQ